MSARAGRPRRRVFRESTAKEYDRHADSPSVTPTNEEEREVLLDPDQEEQSSSAEFWREQRPPHHG